MNTPTAAALPSGQPAVEPAPPRPPAHPEGDQCPNCGAALWGEFCFACGQPRKGLIRRFTSILGDFLDTVFSLDNRIWRTLAPLYFLPGQLSLEYFAGRRVRYVTPFRLFFFLCVLAFLALQWLAEAGDNAIQFGEESRSSEIRAATTPEAVDAALARELARIDAGSAAARAGIASAGEAAPMARAAAAAIDAALEEGRRELREDAEQRKAWLARVAEAEATGATPPADPFAGDGPSIRFGDKPWHPQTNPIAIGWLPDAVNDNLNQRLGRAQEALKHAREDPRPLIEAFFGAIPPVLFVLMPLFALVLKGFYLFKRRLYMEHLLVALHSHAFIFLSLLLVALMTLLRDALAAPDGALAAALGWLAALMGWWVPVYLLVAQKRIYRQGWIMTLLKFGLVGITYVVLLSLGLAMTVLMGLLTL